MPEDVTHPDRLKPLRFGIGDADYLRRLKAAQVDWALDNDPRPCDDEWHELQFPCEQFVASDPERCPTCKQRRINHSVPLYQDRRKT